MGIIRRKNLVSNYEECQKASDKLTNEFSDRKWFCGCRAGVEEGIEVIYLYYNEFCPESHVLYLYMGFPVLMRKKILTVAQ